MTNSTFYFATSAAGLVSIGASQALAQGCLNYQNRQHCPGSGTVLELVGSALTASAADATPFITITTTADRNYGTRYEPIHFENDRSNGFAVANVGTVNSVPNLTLGNLYFIYEPSTNVLEATGSTGLTADGITIEIRNNGEVVGTAFDFSGQISATTIGAPPILETGMITAAKPYSLVARFETAVEWSVQSMRATGDELIFVPAGRVDTIDSLDFATVEGIFIPSFTIIDEYGVRLRATGSCPESVFITISGASPSGTVALAYSFAPGSIRIPSGHCAGTVLGLDRSAVLAQSRRADGSGTAIFSATVPPVACGRVLVEAIDAGTCATSNVEVLE